MFTALENKNIFNYVKSYFPESPDSDIREAIKVAKMVGGQTWEIASYALLLVPVGK